MNSVLSQDLSGSFQICRLAAGVLLMTALPVAAQTWARVYTGEDGRIPYAMIQTSEGGILLAGHWTEQVTFEREAWFLKLDAAGIVEWETRLGGSGYEEIHSVVERPEGGFVAVGSEISLTGGSQNAWIVELSAEGGVLAQWSLGGPEDDWAFAVENAGGGDLVIV